MYAAWRGEGTVLVVDDEEGVRDVAARMLGGLGFQTVIAADGREALRMVSSGDAGIVAVLLDLSMPRLGGEETYRRLRADHPDLPIVLMSGYTEQAEGQHLTDSGLGVTRFLQKPFLSRTSPPPCIRPRRWPVAQDTSSRILVTALRGSQPLH